MTNQDKDLINIELLQRLKEQIDLIDVRFHPNILNIIKKHNIHYSSNINGIFVNISNITHEVYNNLQTFIDRILDQEKFINMMEQEKQNFIESLNNDA